MAWPFSKKSEGTAISKRNGPSLELTEDDKIVQEAQTRFNRCRDWESQFQALYKDDVKFANGDSDNGWQWPHDLKKEREKNKRPSLTINKVAQKVNLIVNDARENKTSVTIKPVGNDTSFQAAQIYEGIVRHIEYVSQAQTIYNDALESAVEGGIGWWRVGTKFDSDTVNQADQPDVSWFDQSIYIMPVKNQLGVYLDPDIDQTDGSDARYGFVFSDVPRDEEEIKYPDVDFTTGGSTLSGPDSWVILDSVRECEYYRIVEKMDELVYVEDEHGTGTTFFKSAMPKEFRDEFKRMEDSGAIVRKRQVSKRTLEWYKIVGNAIVDRRKLKGKYVPLVRTIGVERVIDGQLFRTGHVRRLKDPQRMYNYNSSGQVEFGALQTKTPWVGVKEAFEGNEDAWNRANVQNAAYLTVNGYDSEGHKLDLPQRPAAPGSSPAYMDGMHIADHEMDMASGQYEAVEGKSGNERSGKAIQERQRPAEKSTGHFADHQAAAIRYTGMIILDMLPHYYDTERIIQTRGRDGVESKVFIKPDLDKVMEQEKDGEALKVMFNPKIGRYIVEADVGPAYGTQRQEAWNAFVQIVTGAPELINEIGDLMFRSADFPLADKIAERLMRKIKVEKPYLFDDQAPTPTMVQLQGQVKDLTQQVGEAMQALAEKRLKLIGKEQMRDIDAYNAETTRLKGVADASKVLGEREDLDEQIKKTLHDMFGIDLTEQVAKLGGEDVGHEVENGGGEPLDVPDMGVGGWRNSGLKANGDLSGRLARANDGNMYTQHPDTGQFLHAQPIPGQQPQ